MVGGLASLFQDLDRPAGLLGHARDHVGEELAADQPEHEHVTSTPSGSSTSMAARLSFK